MAELIKTIKDVPVANDAIYEELAKLSKMSKKNIREMVEFVGTYTAGVIKSGFMEDVMIPYFGKFKVKKAKVQYLQTAKGARRNGTNMIRQAVTGKRIIDYRSKNDNNETV